MNVLEIINVRLSDPKDSQKLLTILDDIRSWTSGVSAGLYRDAEMDSDWSVHLHREENSEHPVKSSLALQLVDYFRPLGMINHSVLISEAGG